MTNYMYNYQDWKFEIMEVAYGKKNVVIMKNKHFPLLEYSFQLSRKETDMHDLAINVISRAYKEIDKALLYFKLQTVGTL